MDVGDSRGSVDSDSGGPGALPDPLSQVCGSKIVSERVTAPLSIRERHSRRAQWEGSNCPQAVGLVQFLAEERIGRLLAQF